MDSGLVVPILFSIREIVFRWTLGFTYTGEDGEEYEAFERVPCRCCAEEAT